MEQMNTAETPAPQQSVSGLSFTGIFKVFYDPAGFFSQLKNDPKILVPYIFLVIIWAAFFFLAGDLLVKMQLESPDFQERLQGRTPGEQEIQIIKYATIGAGIVFLSLTPLVLAGLGLMMGNFFMGLKARFKQLLSVMLYGEILFAVGGLVMVPMMLAKNTVAVSLSLAVLVADQGVDSIPYLALSKVGLFMIWEIIVVGIGLAAAYNIPRNKGYVISVLSVGLLSALHVVFTAIMKAIS